jgi:hypothetical protein
VALVIVSHGAGAAVLHRRPRLGAVQRLNLGSHGDLWVKIFGSRFHGKSPVVARYPRSEPVA